MAAGCSAFELSILKIRIEIGRPLMTDGGWSDTDRLPFASACHACAARVHTRDTYSGGTGGLTDLSAKAGQSAGRAPSDGDVLRSRRRGLIVNAEYGHRLRRRGRASDV